MRYLFFDLEYATSKGNNVKICEFGYVITDEHFNIQDSGNYIINPNIQLEEWDWKVVKNLLHRRVKEYEEEAKFNEYYNIISKLIKSADYVFGHTLIGDAKALNDDCLRYNLPSINFEFYDVKELYKMYSSTENSTSVVNILKELEVEAKEGQHDAEVDSINTMYALKTMLARQNITLTEFLNKCPGAFDYNKDYKVHSIEANILREKEMYKEDIANNTIKSSRMNEEFKNCITNIKASKEEEKTLDRIIFAVSSDYEKNYRKQIYNIIQLLRNKGASYTRRGSRCNYYVKADFPNKDGVIEECNKFPSVQKAIEEGKDIKIISFAELLLMLDITMEELNNMPMVSLKEEKIEKVEKVEKPIKKEEVQQGNSLKSLFGDLFEKLKEEIEN